MTLERLRIANEGHDGWILVLGLDGLDENGWRSSNRIEHIRELVRRARESLSRAPSATSEWKLIITCRNRREVDDLLAGPGVGCRTPSEDREIPLDVFDNTELREIWLNWFPHLAFPALPDAEGDRGLELISDVGRATTAIDQRVVEMLRNPTILGCFRELSEPERRDVLVLQR
jgi:hypothetical protein